MPEVNGIAGRLAWPCPAPGFVGHGLIPASILVAWLPLVRPGDRFFIRPLQDAADRRGWRAWLR